MKMPKPRQLPGTSSKNERSDLQQVAILRDFHQWKFTEDLTENWGKSTLLRDESKNDSILYQNHRIFRAIPKTYSVGDVLNK